jgi:hypothetical protein
MRRVLTNLICFGILAAVSSPAPSQADPLTEAPGVGVWACVIQDGNGETPAGEMPWKGPDNDVPSVSTGFGQLVVPSDGVRPVRWTEYAEDVDILMPQNGLRNTNGLSLYFSSATGGFGFRMGYDRRLSPLLRLIAGNEYMTFGPLQASEKLGEHLRPGVQRVTLISMPVGLQRQFGVKRRIVPHVGFGVGPYVRFDHRGGYGGYPSGGLDFGTGTGGGYNGMDVRLTQWGSPVGGFSNISFTLGGYVLSGLNVRFGKDKDLAVTTDGRYTLARFSDALGSPGDLSGFSLSIGVGKYF